MGFDRLSAVDNIASALNYIEAFCSVSHLPLKLEYLLIEILLAIGHLSDLLSTQIFFTFYRLLVIVHTIAASIVRKDLPSHLVFKWLLGSFTSLNFLK